MTAMIVAVAYIVMFVKLVHVAYIVVDFVFVVAEVIRVMVELLFL